MTHDTLPFIRTQTIRIIFQLLKDSPEQEQNLLRLLVNKLVSFVLIYFLFGRNCSSLFPSLVRVNRATLIETLRLEHPTTSSNSSKPTPP